MMWRLMQVLNTDIAGMLTLANVLMYAKKKCGAVSMYAKKKYGAVSMYAEKKWVAVSMCGKKRYGAMHA